MALGLVSLTTKNSHKRWKL